MGLLAQAEKLNALKIDCSRSWIGETFAISKEEGLAATGIGAVFNSGCRRAGKSRGDRKGRSDEGRETRVEASVLGHCSSPCSGVWAVSSSLLILSNDSVTYSFFSEENGKAEISWWLPS